MSPETLVDLLGSALERHADLPALRWKDEGVWNGLSYGALRIEVEETARGLIASGVRKGDRVCLLCGSRPDWVVADLSILWAGAVAVPLYATSSVATARFVFRHCEAKWILLSDDFLPLAREAKLPTQILRVSERGKPRFEALRREGERTPMAGLKERRQRILPEDLAAVLYTSGTTGEPKGVMLTHDNLARNVVAMTSVVKIGPGDRTLSFLPLSHALEQTAGIFAMLSQGVTVSFAEEMTTIARDLLEVRPTILIAVPRMLEKFHARVREVAASRPRWIRALFAHSLRAPRNPLYDFLFFRRIRAGFGGSIRFVVSGGAALPERIARFFQKAGVEILEGYGLTETSPVVTVNRPGKVRIGTVGPALPGVEIRTAPDGEILVRGPNVMKGYFKDPEGTAEAIDPDGWFRTGDVGTLERDGYLRITDRKKDLIVTSGGKKVAPQPIESELLQDPILRQVCLVGEGRHYVSALIVPDFDLVLPKARAAGIEFSSREELIRHPEVRRWFEGGLARVNRGRTSYETVKRFRLLSSEWTVESGELTPTQKVRRKEIARNHAAAIEELYEEV